MRLRDQPAACWSWSTSRVRAGVWGSLDPTSQMGLRSCREKGREQRPRGWVRRGQALSSPPPLDSALCGPRAPHAPRQLREVAPESPAEEAGPLPRERERERRATGPWKRHIKHERTQSQPRLTVPQPRKAKGTVPSPQPRASAFLTQTHLQRASFLPTENAAGAKGSPTNSELIYP